MLAKTERRRLSGQSLTTQVGAQDQVYAQGREVAILGISRGTQEPVYNGSAFEPRLMLPLSLSYDHRVIDGADAARFLRWVAAAFEQPFVLAL